MKAKDVLNIWTGWDSPDIFQVHETVPNGRFISRHDMTGEEFMRSPWAERNLKRFGSHGKGANGVWRHYIEVAAE